MTNLPAFISAGREALITGQDHLGRDKGTSLATPRGTKGGQ